MPLQLTARTAGGGRVTPQPDGWRLSLGAADSGYQLAQLDSYASTPRRHFSLRAPLHIQLRARASHAQLPGTWGFGLWNDPFGFSLGLGGNSQLPALPNAAWFFFASPRNHLSLDNALPGHGALAAAYRAARIPSLLLAPALLALPLLAWPTAGRGLRHVASHVIRQAAHAMPHDACEWHTYEIDWQANQLELCVDGHSQLRTPLSPHGPLGLVLWLDNQYAAWLPSGRMHYGTEPATNSWIEISNLQVE